MIVFLWHNLPACCSRFPHSSRRLPSRWQHLGSLLATLKLRLKEWRWLGAPPPVPRDSPRHLSASHTHRHSHTHTHRVHSLHTYTLVTHQHAPSLSRCCRIRATPGLLFFPRTQPQGSERFSPKPETAEAPAATCTVNAAAGPARPEGSARVWDQAMKQPRNPARPAP